MSTVAGKRADLAIQKNKRQQKIAIIGAVLLIGILAFQVPRLMKHFHSNTNTVDTNLTATPPTPTPGATTPGSTTSGATAPTPVAPSTLPDTDRVTVTPGSGQLISFGLFKSKDPFVQQLSNNTTPASTTATPTPTGSLTTPPKKKAPTPTTPGIAFPTTPTTPASSVTPPATSTPAPTTSTPAPTTPPGSVAIRIGGACQVVALHGTFPKGVDIFRVESIGKDGSIKISVNGGTYESGAATVTLKKGATLTLMNTADGTRYVLKLVSSCPATSSAGAAVTPTTPTSTTSTTSTTPTTTVTTPVPTSTTP